MSIHTRKLGYTTSEAARRLGVSLSTIRRWSDLGYLRSYRTPGGQRRFSGQQLDEFLESLESSAQGGHGGDDEDSGREPHRHHEEPRARGLYDAGADSHARGPQVWPPVNAA